MKTKRNLSGIYFRFKNPETKKWENWCFEDLPRKKQEEILNKENIQWLNSMILKLADTLNDIGDKFDIIIY